MLISLENKQKIVQKCNRDKFYICIKGDGKDSLLLIFRLFSIEQFQY